MRYTITGLLASTLLASGPIMAEVHQSEHHDFRAVTLIENLQHPWSIAFLPNGDWLITERPGRLRLVQDGELAGQPVAGTPDVVAENQGGLLDVVLHPDFENNGYVYLTYAKRCQAGGNTTAVGRGVWDNGQLNNFEELYKADACAPGGRHHGSRLVFDDKGYMFVTIGDRGVQDEAQDPTNNIGVTLRLNDDGSIPEDNPFAGSDKGHDANWTWGNRNAQGMAIHPATGDILQNEHGPRGGDEINLIKKGRNYGWPKATGGTEYNGSIITEKTHEEQGFEPPLKDWTPSIASSGLAIYDGDAFPNWRYDTFNGALAQQHIARVRFDDQYRIVEEEKLLHGTIGRVRDIRVGPDGLIYVLTDSGNGKLVRLEPVE